MGFGWGLLKYVRRLGTRTLEGRKARPQSRTRPRGRDGAGRGPESAPGRQAAESKWSRVFREAKRLGTSCRRPCSAFGARFLAKFRARGPFTAPERPILTKNGLGRRGRTSGVGNPPSSADLNDARKRGRSPSADRRRGWARGGLPRTASPRAPPPEARRAEPPQAAKRARQNAAKNPADLHAEGNARGGGERANASEFHPEPSRGRRRRDGGARNGQPPAQAAPRRASGGAVAEAGAAIPRAAPAARGQRSGAKRRACGGLLEGRRKGGRKAAAQWGRPRKGLDWSRQRGARRAGLWGKRAQEGRRAAQGMKPGAMNAERPDIEGSRCKRYAVMFYCISMAVLLIWCQTHRISGALF